MNSNYHYLLWYRYIVRRYWAPAKRRHSNFRWWWWWWVLINIDCNFLQPNTGDGLRLPFSLSWSRYLQTWCRLLMRPLPRGRHQTGWGGVSSACSTAGWEYRSRRNLWLKTANVSKQTETSIPELSTDWVHPWIRLGLKPVFKNSVT